MPESYYKKWIRIFFALALFNFVVFGINLYRLSINVQSMTGLGLSDLLWAVFLIAVNAATCIAMLYRVHIIRKEQKQKMWDILNTPAHETDIWQN